MAPRRSARLREQLDALDNEQSTTRSGTRYKEAPMSSLSASLEPIRSLRKTPQINTSPRCRLLELPAELRNQIYELVLTQNLRCRRDPPPGTGVSLPGPGLLRTCKMIYQEALALYYRYTTFEFGSICDLTKWSGAIGLGHLKLVSPYPPRR